MACPGPGILVFLRISICLSTEVASFIFLLVFSHSSIRLVPVSCSLSQQQGQCLLSQCWVSACYFDVRSVHVIPVLHRFLLSHVQGLDRLSQYEVSALPSGVRSAAVVLVYG